MITEAKPPYLFDIGDILIPHGYIQGDGQIKLWLMIGGVRNILDMSSGYTMASIDSNRWMSFTKLKGWKVKYLKFRPQSNDFKIPVFYL